VDSPEVVDLRELVRRHVNALFDVSAVPAAPPLIADEWSGVLTAAALEVDRG
jgi:hypothetical protein